MRALIHPLSGTIMQKPSGLKPPSRGGKHSSPMGRTSTGSTSASATAAATGSKEGAQGQGWKGEGLGGAVDFLEEPLCGQPGGHQYRSSFCLAVIALQINWLQALMLALRKLFFFLLSQPRRRAPLLAPLSDEEMEFQGGLAPCARSLNP